MLHKVKMAHCKRCQTKDVDDDDDDDDDDADDCQGRVSRSRKATPSVQEQSARMIRTTAKDRSPGLAKQFHVYKNKAREPIQCADPIPPMSTIQVRVLSLLFTQITVLLFALTH